MANNYGYMAKIGLADDGLDKALAEINNYLKETDRNLASTEKAIANAGKQGLDTTSLLEQQYDLLNSRIEATTEKLMAIRKRTAGAENRTRFGHWESDTVLVMRKTCCIGNVIVVSAET